MMVYTIQENDSVIAVCDNMLRVEEWLNEYFGYNVWDFKQDYRDYRVSGLECTFTIDSDEYLIKYFLLND